MPIHLDVRWVCTSFWNWNLTGVFTLHALSEYIPFSFFRTHKAAIISFTWSNISILGKSKSLVIYVSMISNLLNNFTDLSYPRHVKNYFCTRVGRVVSQPLPVRGREIHLELSRRLGMYVKWRCCHLFRTYASPMNTLRLSYFLVDFLPVYLVSSRKGNSILALLLVHVFGATLDLTLGLMVAVLS